MPPRSRRVLVMLVASLAALACGGRPEEAAPLRSPYPRDGELRLNQVQAKATHNSYHLEPADPLDASHRYSHVPLTRQLEEQGVRGFELDFHYREGAGFQVFHLPLIDAETTCIAFADCLAELEAWSSAHPWHLPLMIWLEPKDDADVLDGALLPLDDKLFELEAAIVEVIPRRRILTPDELRGAHADLPAALAAEGWPTLGALRGRFVFGLLDSGDHRTTYLEGAPALEGRLLFVDAAAGEPFAALIKDADPAEGRALVEAGYLVTTNVDGAAADDATNAAELAAHLPSGIQYLAGDFPGPVADRDYVLELPGGAPARCNPVLLPAGCTAADIEVNGGAP